MCTDSRTVLSDDDLDRELTGILDGVFSGRGQTDMMGRITPGPVLVLPPDLTRIHSRAGVLAGIVCRELALCRGLWSLGAIMPALGTHRPLSPHEIARMFPACPRDAFVPHRWREDTVELGRLEADWVETAFCGERGRQGGSTSSGFGTSPGDTAAFHTSWPVEVNRILRDGLSSGGKKPLPFSLIVSIGQVVPHEIAGMANHAKNIFVGTGGAEAIHKSHWLGALYGMERLMGEAENPVRSLFDEAFRRYAPLLPPVFWILTVVDSSSRVRGLFCGFGRKCFEDAAVLSAEVNIERISGLNGASSGNPAGHGVRKIVVWLDEKEYRSTWLGNKAIYRTRRALVDGGELLVLAPGLDCFGEDPALDALIRRYGYRGKAAIRQAVEKAYLHEGENLADNLSAAAHLVHGSSEGRFTIRYCTPPGNSSASAPSGLLGRASIEGVGYEWGSLEEAAARYVPRGPDAQEQGWNTAADGEVYYYIRNPALGLWI